MFLEVNLPLGFCYGVDHILKEGRKRKVPFFLLLSNDSVILMKASSHPGNFSSMLLLFLLGTYDIFHYEFT